MAEPNQHREEENLDAPDRLVNALNNLQKERIFVPPAVDKTVLLESSEHLRRLERPQSRWKPRLSWAAMAACLALVVWLGEQWSNPGRRFAREDINRDGRVDVLDAFTLARQIESGGAVGARWDINGDGRVDGADVNAIAARAVNLAQARPAPKRSADLRKPGEGVHAVWRTEVRAPFLGTARLRVNALPASCRYVFGAQRSAEFYSAASQGCTLTTVGISRCVGAIPRSADSKSAIRQIENLRYKTSACPGEGFELTPVAQSCKPREGRS